ncbi:uracil-DNA glycosylase [Candidatus Blochmanniella floridana]|uniref:Uracil-DNA glycosylase n=1 Tax=Blochmanniella floridana TaxID=203907 RepID=UNG_BLOFL|nr:RecName: Full=Uracil-DNA glycosylase; Short=UDG [Candidatus Blochmannia floridanus]CAD83229.1 uracil-DNA glycosylase [Candidatus Blochmannia floridanus]
MPKLTWQLLLSQEKNLPYFKNIFTILNQQKKSGKIIYPKQNDIFNVFRFTAFESIKVVIIGQDPYHGYNQAHGLAFSVPHGIPLPPSLKNIYKELETDIPGFIKPQHGCLSSWSKEGVFLLNSILTVEQGKSRSHAHIGWELFTDKVIHTLNTYRQNLVFLLWGKHAQQKSHIINNQKHHILITSHPSPISAKYGFLGCKHFSKTNTFLANQNQHIINWQL